MTADAAFAPTTSAPAAERIADASRIRAAIGC
jgi:hypothetical protein